MILVRACTFWKDSITFDGKKKGGGELCVENAGSGAGMQFRHLKKEKEKTKKKHGNKN